MTYLFQQTLLLPIQHQRRIHGDGSRTTVGGQHIRVPSTCRTYAAATSSVNNFLASRKHKKSAVNRHEAWRAISACFFDVDLAPVLALETSRR
jgi:hypothetical protein